MESVIVDGYRFVKDKKSGYWQCNQFIAKEGKPKRLHRYIWEKYHGTIKPGYDVHHIDKNKDNNDISNLACLSSHDHQHLHGVEKVKNNPEWFAEFHQRGIESAPKWHASTEGREWHLKHFEAMKDKLYAKKEFVCEQCGKTFSAQENGRNRFCSNACKSKWRRNNHIDDVERTCVICGTKFSANKYSKKKPAHVVVPQSSRLPKGVKIKSIKFSGYEDVYDMYVKNHHNFAVNGGFIVHNCDALRYAMEPFMFRTAGQYMSNQERIQTIKNIGLG